MLENPIFRARIATSSNTFADFDSPDGAEAEIIESSVFLSNLRLTNHVASESAMIILSQLRKRESLNSHFLVFTIAENMRVSMIINPT
jgi:hypothetical protein